MGVVVKSTKHDKKVFSWLEVKKQAGLYDTEDNSYLYSNGKGLILFIDDHEDIEIACPKTWGNDTFTLSEKTITIFNQKD